MTEIKEFFQNLVESDVVSQEPTNYDAATLKIYIAHLEAENAALRARLKNAVELPVKAEDTVYCIRNCGTGRYRVEEYTVTEIVFEYDNQMRIKTGYGLFGCEKWTYGLDCFTDRAKAAAKLEELC